MVCCPTAGGRGVDIGAERIISSQVPIDSLKSGPRDVAGRAKAGDDGVGDRRAVGPPFGAEGRAGREADRRPIRHAVGAGIA